MRNKSKKPKHPIHQVKLTKLVQKAQNGDQKSLEAIVTATSDYIYYYCLTLLRDEDKALEAVQDIYVILLQKLNGLKEPESFLGWLKVITANYCKNKINRTKENISIDENEINFEDVQLSPPRQVESKEICAAVIAAVHALPDLQKECVLMYYYQEMSVSQISAVLGIKPGTVKSRLYNARQAVKAELEKHGINKSALNAVSPTAYIAHSLISDASGKSCKVALADIPASTASAVAEASGSNAALASAAAGFSTAAKSGIGIRIAAAATAGTLAAGGIATHTISQLRAENATADSAFVTQATDVTEETSAAVMFDNEYAVRLLTEHGFSKSDLRKERSLSLDPAQRNSMENKEYIFDRMCNSLDYFETLQSIYIDMRKDFDGNPQYYIVGYTVDKTNHRAKELVFDFSDYIYGNDSYLKPLCYFAIDNDKAAYLRFSDANQSLTDMYTLEFNPSFDNYEDSPFPKIEKCLQIPLARDLINNTPGRDDLIYYINRPFDDDDYIRYIDPLVRVKLRSESGAWQYMRHDEDIQLSYSFYQYSSEHFAFEYLRNFDKWSITEIDAATHQMRIEGEYNGVYDNAEGMSFEMTVNYQTGMVLLLESLGTDYDKIPCIQSLQYIVDEEIDQSVFDKLV